MVTGTRAEYGLLYWLLKEIEADPELELQLVVTGMHLSPRFGLTFRVIEEDGFTIARKVDIGLDGDSPKAVITSMGLGTIGMAEVFDELRPDVALVLGDRFEILAAAQAALIARIPLAHIQGGELSEGAMDDAMRHAITKLAHLHFTACDAYSKRVIQLGEDPSRVFTVGALGVEGVVRFPPLSREDLEQALGFSLGDPTFLVTYHPTTLSPDDPGTEVEALLSALDGFSGARTIFTGVNADPGHQAITERVHRYASDRPDTVNVCESLGQRRYLALMREADVVIGNSSSGIIEAPALKTPTVNIGDRQKGRLRASSIIDCGTRREDIEAAIATALDPAFRANLADMVSPYEGGGTAVKIRDVLRNADLSEIVHKAFYDLPVHTQA